MKLLKGDSLWLRLLEMSINVNIVASLLLLVYFVYIYSCSVVCGFLFTCFQFFFIPVLVVVFLFTCFQFFYAGVCCCIFFFFFV